MAKIAAKKYFPLNTPAKKAIAFHGLPPMGIKNALAYEALMQGEINRLGVQIKS